MGQLILDVKRTEYLERRRIQYARRCQNKQWHEKRLLSTRLAYKRRLINDPTYVQRDRQRKRQRGQVKIAAYRNFMREMFCAYCFESNPVVLQWAHVEAHTKSTCVTSLIKRSPLELVTEMNKCVILCANCHCIYDNRN